MALSKGLALLGWVQKGDGLALKYQVHDTDEKHAVLPHPREGSMLFRYPLVS